MVTSANRPAWELPVQLVLFQGTPPRPVRFAPPEPTEPEPEDIAIARRARFLEDRAERLLRQFPDAVEIIDDRRTNEVLRAYQTLRMRKAVDAVTPSTQRERGDLAEARRCLEQGAALRWELALLNDGYARSEARRLVKHGHEFDDILQVARIGLHKAALRFDPDRGVRFGTYSRHWVRETLNRHTLAKTTPLGMPVTAAQQRLRLRRLVREHEAAGEEWTYASLAASEGYSEARVVELLHVDDNATVIDALLPEGDRPADRIADPTAPTPEEDLVESRSADEDLLRLRWPSSSLTPILAT
jgi:DNA-directed RNA polymerase, sigma subunit (sigma70/sigma32)